MTFCIYTNSISAHQLPLAREIARLVGVENFRYIYESESLKSNQRIDSNESWVLKANHEVETIKWLAESDAMLVGGIRPIALIEKRLATGKVTFFMSERWFKPFDVGVGHRCRCSVPGWVRLFHPKYFKMAKRFVALFQSPCYRFLPIGPWSAHDMRLLCRIMSFLHLHLRPTPTFIPWGDFVSGSDVSRVERVEHEDAIKVLWVGRMLNWKRVDTLIMVARMCKQFQFTIVGNGPVETSLKELANGLENIEFHSPVSLSEVRNLMRSHDIYVLPSNAYEGWGAVVPEALTEGMTVIGTYEGGASAALLPKENLFHCGDWKTLAKMLIEHSYRHVELPYDYTPRGAAERLLREAQKIGVGERCRCRERGVGVRCRCTTDEFNFSNKGVI